VTVLALETGTIGTSVVDLPYDTSGSVGLDVLIACLLPEAVIATGAAKTAAVLEVLQLVLLVPATSTSGKHVGIDEAHGGPRRSHVATQSSWSQLPPVMSAKL